MKKLMVIQPVLAEYRIEEFKILAHHFDMLLLFSSPEAGSGFNSKKLPELPFKHFITKTISIIPGKIFLQKQILTKLRVFQPDIVLACASTRDLSFWILLLYCYLHNLPVYSWGHGPGKKEKNLVIIFLYKFILLLTKKYITYTHASYLSFKKLGLNVSKVSVAENSIINSNAIPYETKIINCKGILFIGRLRKGSNLELLIDACKELKDESQDIHCHIIGGGSLSNYYKTKYQEYSFITWYDEVYDNKIISEISQTCVIGCYPGNTGLSVVHYMSLSLPVIIHNNTEQHGPEATYIVNGYNGQLFNNNSKDSLKETIRELLNNTDTIKKLSRNSFLTYSNLNNPGLAEKIISILES